MKVLYVPRRVSSIAIETRVLSTHLQHVVWGLKTCLAGVSASGKTTLTSNTRVILEHGTGHSYWVRTSINGNVIFLGGHGGGVLITSTFSKHPSASCSATVSHGSSRPARDKLAWNTPGKRCIGTGDRRRLIRRDLPLRNSRGGAGPHSAWPLRASSLTAPRVTFPHVLLPPGKG